MLLTIKLMVPVLTFALKSTTLIQASNCVNLPRELNCRHKNYSSRIVLLLVWIDSCNNPTSIFTNCLIVLKYPCIKWLWVFSLLRRFCHMYNIENNAWPFPCHHGYHPETPISVWDAAVADTERKRFIVNWERDIS